MNRFIPFLLSTLVLMACSSTSSEVSISPRNTQVSQGSVEWGNHTLYSGYEGILSLLLWDQSFAFQYSGLEIGDEQGQVRFLDLADRSERENRNQYTLEGIYGDNMKIVQRLIPTETGIRIRLEWDDTFSPSLYYANLALHLNPQITRGGQYLIHGIPHSYPDELGSTILQRNLHEFQLHQEYQVLFRSSTPFELADARAWGGLGFDLIFSLKNNSSPLEVDIELPLDLREEENSLLHELRFSGNGYAPNSDKAAFLEWPIEAPPPEDSWVELINARGEVVLSKEWEPQGNQWQFSYAIFEFSEITTPGEYRIRWAGGESPSFPIGQEVFSHLWQDALDNYIPWQMCHAQVYPGGNAPAHGACHLDDGKAVDPEAKEIDGFYAYSWPDTQVAPGEPWNCAIGGWHDAGDYDLHLAAQSMTVQHLALVYEEFQLAYDNASLDYGQGLYRGNQGDGIPDVLQQCLWGSLWLLSMQQQDGRFYQGIVAEEEQYLAHCAPEKSTDGIPETGDERNVYTDYHSSEQLKAVIALASASRVLGTHYPQIAMECRQAALLGYQYYKSESPSWHSQTAFLIREPSPYGEAQSEVSAAAELFFTTGDSGFLLDIERQMPLVLETPHYWPHPDYTVRMNHIYAGPYLARIYQRIPDESLRADIETFLQGNFDTKEYLFSYESWPYSAMANPWYGMNQFAVRMVFDYYYINQVINREQGLNETLPLFYWLTGLHPLDNKGYIIGAQESQPNRIFGKQLIEIHNEGPYAIDGAVAPGLCTQGHRIYFNQNPYSFQCIEPVIDVSATLIFAALALEEAQIFQ